jgi:hypothetical protein
MESPEQQPTQSSTTKKTWFEMLSRPLARFAAVMAAARSRASPDFTRTAFTVRFQIPGSMPWSSRSGLSAVVVQVGQCGKPQFSRIALAGCCTIQDMLRDLRQRNRCSQLRRQALDGIIHYAAQQRRFFR